MEISIVTYKRRLAVHTLNKVIEMFIFYDILKNDDQKLIQRNEIEHMR